MKISLETSSGHNLSIKNQLFFICEISCSKKKNKNSENFFWSFWKITFEIYCFLIRKSSQTYKSGWPSQQKANLVSKGISNWCQLRPKNKNIGRAISDL
jgi:hypothetical protein